MTITWQAEDNVEPIADTTIEGIANFNAYSVTSGCGLTYSAANMTVTVAAGSVLHNGTTVTVAGNTVTLVSDATNPRWTWIGIPSNGTAAIVSGTAAATPTVPEIGDYVPLALVYVQANLAIANSATYKLDKRVIYTGLPAIMTTAGDMVYASGANTPTRLAKGTANQALLMNSGATAPAWGSSLQSLMTTAGDTVYASSANTPSRLAAGTANQALLMNSGATAPTWGASLQTLMTNTGDIVYASSANTPARLGVGSNGQVLTLASGIPSWASGPPKIQRKRNQANNTSWTFPTAFSATPVVCATPMGDTSSTKGRMITLATVSTTAVTPVCWSSSSVVGAPSPDEINIIAMDA